MADYFVKVKVPVTGFFGAGAGISIGTLVGEWTSRATGQVAWNAAVVKGAVKGGIGLLTLGLSKMIGSPLGSFFCEMMTYGAWGSWFIDIALAAYPGGIPGLAEDWAKTARIYAAGSKAVNKSLGELEKGQGQEVAASIF